MRYNRRYDNDEDRFSKDYGQNWNRIIGGLFVAGIVIAIIIGIVKGLEWLYHNF